MNKIVIYRTHIDINDYDMGDCTRLENIFSVWDPVYYKDKPKGYVYDEVNRVLKVSRGCDVSFLESLFNTTAVVDHTCSRYDFIGEVEMKYLPRDDVQQTALRFTLGLKEFTHNQERSMMCLNLSTGKGKSYCSIATMIALNIKSIVITDSINWLNQWKNFILEYTTIKEEDILLISGTPSINRSLKRDMSQYKIYLVTHATLKSYASSYGWESLSNLFEYLGIGLKFYDEAHLNFDNMYHIDFHTNVFKTYYITASPGRSAYSEDIIFSYYFKNIPSINLFDQDTDPHTEYVAIKYNSHPTAQQAQYCKNQFGFDRNKYAKYIVEKENFYKILYIIICMAMRKSGKHLIYIGLNDSILVVKDWIEDIFPELIGLVGIYTSIITENKAQELDKKIILTTTKSAGAAVDIPNLVETINLAEPFKSKILAQQTFGRTREEGTMYKDIVDMGFSYSKKYYEAKKPIFSKYATKCSEIVLNDNDLDTSFNKEKDKHDSLIQPIIVLKEGET